LKETSRTATALQESGVRQLDCLAVIVVPCRTSCQYGGAHNQAYSRLPVPRACGRHGSCQKNKFRGEPRIAI